MSNHGTHDGQLNGHQHLSPRVTGPALLGDPMLNRGTAFTPAERNALGLIGLLPPAVTTLDEQAKRSYAEYQQQPTDLAKNVFLTALQDRNEVLCYRLLADHLAEMLPVVYDPTVAQANDGTSLCDAAITSGAISAADFDRIVVPAAMVGNSHQDLGLPASTTERQPTGARQET